MAEKISHDFVPVYDSRSRILILGTLPSVKSRESNFYYGHPQNRFWKVVAALTGSSVPVTVETKKQMLLDSGIGVWDVIASCTIEGSSDSSIKDVVPNDIAGLLADSSIEAVFCNGGKAYELYVKYCEKMQGAPRAIKLPSTSPANAAWKLEKLTDAWKKEIDRYLV